MRVVLPSSSSTSTRFAQIISRTFATGRLAIVGATLEDVEQQFAERKRSALVVSARDVTAKPELGDATPRFEAAIWFYPSGKEDDERMVETLSRCAVNIVLIPGPGAEAAARRPGLIQSFARYGLSPDYTCDLMDLDSAAVCLRRQIPLDSGELTSKVEGAFARTNRALGNLKQILEIRGLELERAERHIGVLEEKLLKMKEYRRELKLLKGERQTLRKSAERRIGQIFLAPCRLPQRLVKSVWKRLQRPARERRELVGSSEYQKWFERHRSTTQDLAQMRRESQGFASKPLISIITPLFNTPVKRLEDAINSVVAQAYENWELVLVDDGSTDSELLTALPALAAYDRRIKLKDLGRHEGISAASNHGIAASLGEWIALLDHDDLIEPDALFQIARLLQTHPDAELIYSDEDKLGKDGFEAPLFKPDWSPDLLLSHNYIGHLTAIRRDTLEKIGGFRPRFDSAQDYDLFFRVIEQTRRIYHIPRVLYHWRRSESSSSISVRQKPEQLEASQLAVEDYLKRRGEQARVSMDWSTHTFCVRRELREPKKISVIVRSRDHESLTQCIKNFADRTSYPNYEVVVIQDEKVSSTSDCSLSLPHRLLRCPGQLNDSAANNFAANKINDPWILFLNETLHPIEPQWLTIMAEHVQRAEVGAVGAQLLNPDGTIEQAGTIIGLNRTAQRASHGSPAKPQAGNRQLYVTRNCSAVSSACMLMRRDLFEQTGGFEEKLDVALAAVDLCLKMRRAGYLIVYTPFAKLGWREAPLDEIAVESEAILQERWGDALGNDPYYNPNLSRERADFSLGN
jgi:GT2 family glycosyltransferase